MQTVFLSGGLHTREQIRLMSNMVLKMGNGYTALM